MSDTRQWKPNSARNKLLFKIARLAVAGILIVILYETGALFTLRNWIAGLYGSGENAVEQSQSHFQSGLAQSRKRQEEHTMGNH